VIAGHPRLLDHTLRGSDIDGGKLVAEQCGAMQLNSRICAEKGK